MTEQHIKMKIGIDGKVYTLDTRQRESLTQIPWKSRKKVIAVLEAMKQAEHIEPAKTSVNPQSRPTQSVNQQTAAAQPKTDSVTDNSTDEVYSKDPDAIMKQLIMQQPSHNIPDKITVIKWIAIIFFIIIALSFIF